MDTAAGTGTIAATAMPSPPMQLEKQGFAYSSASFYLNTSYTKAKQIRRIAMKQSSLLESLWPQMQRLPLEFRNAFETLLGHCICPGRELVDWQEFSSAVKAITYGADNMASLATWSMAAPGPLIEAPDPRHAAYKVLEIYHDLKVEEPDIANSSYYYALWLSMHKSDSCISDVLSSHLQAAACIAAGAFFLKSGSLYLIDTASIPRSSSTNSEGDDLLLVRKTSSGIYMIAWPSSFRSILPSEIKGMKQLVGNYKGVERTGRLRFLAETTSARLAKSIGLSIHGNFARIGPC